MAHLVCVIQWYGTVVDSFKDVGLGIVHLLVLIRGHAPFLVPMATMDPTFTTIFLLGWESLMLVVMVGMIIAVLSDAYKQVRQQMFYHNTLETQDYEMVDILLRRLKRWMGITKPKPVSYAIFQFLHLFYIEANFLNILLGNILETPLYCVYAECKITQIYIYPNFSVVLTH